MITKESEIKVALLGYVGVGKSTVLNALFREKFSEMSRKRETAGVSFFRVGKKVEGGKSDGSVDTKSTDSESTASSESKGEDLLNSKKISKVPGKTKAASTKRKSDSILKEIKTDNQTLRNSKQVHEKVFDIDISETLVEMRDDTSLVIVDIPGINEADTDNIYMNYVEEKWQDFDCVVLIMDASQGVNTTEQVDLLKFVKKNLKEKRNVPVIILGNKVDDADDEQQAELVLEVEKKVHEVFAEKGKTRNAKAGTSLVPKFIPISAKHAFFYRTAALLCFEDFKKFDKDMIDDIGKLEDGHYKWRKRSQAEKYRFVYDIVSESSNYEERLEAANFNPFLEALKSYIGSEDKQLQLIREQVDIGLKKLSHETCTASDLQGIYSKSVLLGKSIDPVKQTFWKIFSASKRRNVSAFKDAFNVECLVEPARLLEEYCAFTSPLKWNDEVEKVHEEAKLLVHGQLDAIVDKYESCFDVQKWETAFLKREQDEVAISACGCPESGDTATTNATPPSDKKSRTAAWAWENLSPKDWELIFDSVSILASNPIFCEHFGSRKILLDQLARKCSFDWYNKQCGCRRCTGTTYFEAPCPSNCGNHVEESFPFPLPSCCLKDSWKLKLQNGKLEPKDPANAPYLLQVKVPDEVSNPKHFGHLAWKCCNLIKAAQTP